MHKKWIDFQPKERIQHIDIKLIDTEEYEAILKPENERTEHAVFKIH